MNYIRSKLINYLRGYLFDFKKAFRDAHDHYHGNSKAANMYWNQFNDDRTASLEELFTPEQHKKYIELIAKESYRGKNNKE